MEPWHRRLPERLLRELRAVDNSELRLQLTNDPAHHLIGWRGHVLVDGTQHYLSILYPLDYPSRPPWVRESRPFTEDVHNDFSTFHQYADGSLCLFAYGTGADAWSSDLTVVDTVGRYIEFRRLANAGSHVDDHGRPLRGTLGVPSGKTFVLTPGQAEVLRAPQGWGTIHAVPLPHGHAFICTRVATGDDSIQVSESLGAWPRTPLSLPLLFHWVRVPTGGTWRATYRNMEAVEAAARQHLPPKALATRRPGGCLMLVRETAAGQIEGAVAEHIEGALHGHDVDVVKLGDALFDRVDGAVSGRSALADTPVAIVGLGSLGGSIALHLARAGVEQFYLFDPDVLRPENVCRHVAGLQYVYLPKVVAVQDLIKDRNPHARVEAFGSSPLWDGAPAASATFEKLLQNPKAIVVVAVAEHDIERALNERTVRHGVPTIYASVLGPGHHGRIFRVLPDGSPCYQCILDQQASEPGRFFRVNDGPTDAGVARRQYERSGIPGLGLDVEQVAVHAARMTLQTLARRSGGALDYPDASGDHLVWTNRGGAAFDLPLQVRWEPYERNPACSVCGPSGAAELSDDERTALQVLRLRLADARRLAQHAIEVGGPTATVAPKRQQPGPDHDG